MRKFLSKPVAILGLAGVLCAVVAAGATVSPKVAEDDPVLAGRGWVEVAHYKLEEGRVRPEQGSGAMGASGGQLKLELPCRGSFIVERLVRPAIAVFIGLSVPPELAVNPQDDLRVVFVELDGTSHATALMAGGGTSILFQSPDGLDVAKLSHFSVLLANDAPWGRR